MRNHEIALAFEEMADLLEIAGADRFRILAYRRAAETMSGLARDVSKLPIAELRGLRGIGKATADNIAELLQRGSFAALDAARKDVPSGLRDLTGLSGLGPKKAALLHAELGVDGLESLEAAIADGRLKAVKGMGEKTEQNLKRALERRQKSSRTLLEAALLTAEGFLEQLRQGSPVVRADYAGSLRRMKETIGDIDLLVAASDPTKVSDAFVNLEDVSRVAATGATKSSIITRLGLQVDLRVVAADEFGAALQYFTGSKEHNVKVREHAVKQGYKLSEYGLFRVSDGSKVAGETEEEVYGALGMQTPIPEMRENRGEVELALKGELPQTLEITDIRGDLHCHTVYSDGRTGIAEMVDAAFARGYEYIGISDHAVKLTHVRHLKVEDLKRQAAEISRLNELMQGRIRILHGVELNIGPKGELDYDPEVLSVFDYRIGSIHQQLQMEPSRMTDRILTALSNPYLNVFGHPTARRINKRPPIEFSMEQVFKAAASNQVALEISGHGERLDLKDDHIFLAREVGCRFAVNTDSHAPDRLWRMRLGVGMSKRGWVTADEVINTRPLKDLQVFFDKR